MPLHIEKVSHSYGTVEALSGIELDIADGETVALIGPSGCGKSTLLGIVGGLLEPTAGRVTFSGQAPSDSLNPFTYIFQDFALLPWRSVADNVGLALEHRALGAAERRERIAAALALTGLAEFASAYPKQLSGGMRQRVGIARAALLEPEFVLADEIVSGLDVSTQAQALNLLKTLTRDLGLAMAFISHDLSVIRAVCDRVYVMRHGVVVEEGRCEEVFAAPKNAYTRLLLDAIPLPEIDPTWLGRDRSEAAAAPDQGAATLSPQAIAAGHA